jgi:Domain of unknown function (DUF3859)
LRLSLVWAQVVFCALTGVALAKPTASHDPALISDFRVGVFCSPDETYTTDARGTIKGSVERYHRSPRLVWETQTIPAIDHILFGVEGRETPASHAIVTITVRHPPLGPGRVKVESWETQMTGAHTTFHGYEIGLSDGNPKGKWTITGTRGTKTLFQAEFQVVRPAKDASNPCTAPSS